MPGWLTQLVHVLQMILGSSATNACTHVQVCGSNGSAAMLAANRSTGVTPEVNLRNTLPVGNEAYKPGIILVLKFRADITKIPKPGSVRFSTMLYLVRLVLLFEEEFASSCKQWL